MSNIQAVDWPSHRDLPTESTVYYSSQCERILAEFYNMWCNSACSLLPSSLRGENGEPSLKQAYVFCPLACFLKPGAGAAGAFRMPSHTTTHHASRTIARVQNDFTTFRGNSSLRRRKGETFIPSKASMNHRGERFLYNTGKKRTSPPFYSIRLKLGRKMWRAYKWISLASDVSYIYSPTGGSQQLSYCRWIWQSIWATVWTSSACSEFFTLGANMKPELLRTTVPLLCHEVSGLLFFLVFK